MATFDFTNKEDIADIVTLLTPDKSVPHPDYPDCDNIRMNPDTGSWGIVDDFGIYDYIREKKITLEMDIEELDLSFCCYHVLKRAGINTVEDITNETREGIMNLPNMRNAELEEVLKKIENSGLELKKQITIDWL